MTITKISYPIRTSINLARATLIGIAAAGAIGLNTMGYNYAKEFADRECANTHQLNKQSYARPVQMNHANVGREIFESEGIIYYLMLPGIRSGIDSHNKQYHKSITESH